MQRDDFHGILKAMHGLPVIIRLIDPPLHEFLPSLEELLVEVTRAKALGKPEKSYRDKAKLLAAVQNLHEQNPMLGLRGCRLGLLFPEIIEMQARAIIEAAVALKKERVDVRPEIMVPLVGTLEELRRTREVIDRDGAGGLQGDQEQGGVPRRHDDRGAARRAHRRTDRAVGGLLLVRHQRPDADDLRCLSRRCGRQVPAPLRGGQDPAAQPVRDP